MASSSASGFETSGLGILASTKRKRQSKTPAEAEEHEIKEEASTDDEDDDTPEGWSDTTGPHDAEAKAPAYDPSIDVMLSESRRRLQSIVELVERHNLRANSTQPMLSRLRDLQQTPAWIKFRILLVGGSGTGKSSIINNILDMQFLTTALDPGKRCTDVPTLYEASLEGQTKPCAALVQFRSPQVIEKLLDVLLSNFYLWYCDREEDWSEDRRDVIRSTAESAIRVFCEMFKEKPGFTTIATAIEWLVNRRSFELHETVSLFYSWCEEILYSFKGNRSSNEIDLIEADTTAELRSLIKRFSHSGERADQAQPWPLVEQIRVGIRGREVLQYITIVDCPGSSDDDSIRSEAFQRMMHGGCHELWIVNRIGRITSERIVASMLANYGRHIPVVVIATAIEDNIDDGLCDAYEDEGLYVEDLRAQIMAVGRLTAKVNKRERSDQRREKRRRISSAQDSQNVTSESTTSSDLRAQLKAGKQLKFEMFVDLRKRWVMEQLRAQYEASLMPGERLDVYGVSNKHYAEAKEGLECVEPRLTLPDTGIPCLRRHIYMKEAVMNNKIQALRYYLNGDLAAALQSFDSLLQPAKDGAHIAMTNLFKSASERLAGIVSERLQNFPGIIEDGFSTRLMHSSGAHIDHALSVLNERRKWNPRTAKAFIWKDGRHSTRRELPQSWDGHFSKTAVADLEKEWSAFTPKIEDFLDDLEKHVSKVLEDLASQHNAILVCDTADRKRFKATTTAYMYRTRRQLRNSRSRLQDAMKATVLCAVTDGPTNYFSCAMFSAYQKCRELKKGRGIMEKCFNALESHMRPADGLRTPFEVMIVRVSEVLEENFDTSARDLVCKLTVLMDEMRNDLLNIVDADTDAAVVSLRPDLASAKADFEQWIVDSNEMLERLGLRYDDDGTQQ